ncbi:MAG: DUF2299 domain-containing protein [Methanobacteriota archaeon]|nr:MAG: DUF2299 domain-containing protein [Euryarchaeota archaeon]
MNIKDAKNQVKAFLDLEGYVWQEEKDITDEIQFALSFRDPITNLLILIIQSFPHRIDIVSNVQLSSEHEKVYLSMSKSKQQELLAEIFMWVTPREPKLFLHFTGEKGDNRYSIVSHVYADEFGLGRFMSTLNKVMKSSVLARQIIQSRLGGVSND